MSDDLAPAALGKKSLIMERRRLHLSSLIATLPTGMLRAAPIPACIRYMRRHTRPVFFPFEANSRYRRQCVVTAEDDPRVTPMTRVKKTGWLNYNRREPLHSLVHSTLLTRKAKAVRCTPHHSRPYCSYRIVARCLLHRRRVKTPASARRQL